MTRLLCRLGFHREAAVPGGVLLIGSNARRGAIFCMRCGRLWLLRQLQHGHARDQVGTMDVRGWPN